MRNYCLNCGTGLQQGQVICTNCGFAVGGGAAARAGNPQEKSKVAAGLLALFLGGLGVHKFYLGYNGAGWIMLGAFFAGCVLAFAGIGILILGALSVTAFCEAIIYLTKSDEQFHDTYVANMHEWF
jgi:TM2 domain-containing membrane protein YozV